MDSRHEAGWDERQLLMTLVREFGRLGERPVIVELGVMEWFVIVGAVQLAMRHPQLSERQGVVFGRVAREMAAAVGQWSPALAEVLELGFEWRNDG